MPITPHVPDSYAHYAKQALPGPVLRVGNSQLKWYDVEKPGEPVVPAFRDLAQEFLAREHAAGRFALDGDLGFVLLHRCGKEFYFLLPGTWRGANELWQSVYHKQNDQMADFALFPLDAGGHHPTWCVWELGVVAHEAQAWARFLSSPRDEAAVETYLGDRFSGPV